MLQGSWGRSGKQQQEQNSPNLKTASWYGSEDTKLEPCHFQCDPCPHVCLCCACPLACSWVARSRPMTETIVSCRPLKNVIAPGGSIRTAACLYTVSEKSLCTWLGECCRQVEAEEVSNGRNKIHQTMYRLIRLQWHRLQWQSLIVTLLEIPKPLLRDFKWLEWQICCYSDIF